MNETVEITPNYKALFALFLNQFEETAKQLPVLEPKTFRLAHQTLVYLNIAAQSISSLEDLELFRLRLGVVIEQNHLRINESKEE